MIGSFKLHRVRVAVMKSRAPIRDATTSGSFHQLASDLADLFSDRSDISAPNAFVRRWKRTPLFSLLIVAVVGIAFGML